MKCIVIAPAASPSSWARDHRPFGDLAPMSTTASRNQPLGRVARVAAWITRHRGRVLLAWLVVLVAAVTLFKSAGSDFSNSLTLPGTQSQAAIDALQRDFPRQAGDQDQIVFAAPHGSITNPATSARRAARRWKWRSVGRRSSTRRSRRWARRPRSV